jgi:hypothetical protein
MSTIDRYRKSGGFIQLLQLIETSGKAKQEKFLEMIKAESPVWESALREKMITIERILSWQESVIAEIFSQVNELTLGTALVGLGEETRERVFKYTSHSTRRRITVIIDEKKDSTAAEHSAAFVKILQEVRDMIKDKRLKPENCDPKIEIPEDIENLLAQGTFTKAGSGDVMATVGLPHLAAVSHAPSAAPSASSFTSQQMSVNKQHAEDLSDLQKRVQFLTQENNNLRLKVRQLEGKLEQIRKIA